MATRKKERSFSGKKEMYRKKISLRTELLKCRAYVELAAGQSCQSHRRNFKIRTYYLGILRTPPIYEEPTNYKTNDTYNQKEIIVIIETYTERGLREFETHKAQ